MTAQIGDEFMIRDRSYTMVASAIRFLFIRKNMGLQSNLVVRPVGEDSGVFMIFPMMN